MIRGEDKALAIKVKDSAGVYQSIDGMVDLIVVVYSQAKNQVIGQFRKVATVGYTTLLRVSATEYTACLTKAMTDLCPIHMMVVEVEIQDTDVRFPANIRRTKGKGQIEEVESTVISV